LRSSFIQNHSAALLNLALIAVFSILILFIFDGSGEEADSFHHYLIAHYAPQHPELYFDHWGKPLYTLLSSSFAQFGLVGSKVFNMLCSLSSAYFAYLICRQFKLKQASLVILLTFLIPLNFQVNFSAFTEPLFALLLMLSVWLVGRSKLNLAIILVSFLPMVRSEGLIILGVFGLYLLLKSQFKKLPLLAFGQLVYGLLAWLFMGKSLLWTVNEIPYAELDSPYGNGDLLHFAEKLFYICGLPLLILFMMGLIWSIFRLRKRSMEWNLLIIASFLAFFVFHSLAWKLGWFNSMGLKRVFGAISPLMGIVMLYGLNVLLSLIKDAKWRKSSAWLYTGISALFLFSGGPAAVNWKHEMNLSPSQELADQMGTYIKEKEIDYERLIYADRYLQNGLGNDPFDPQQSLVLNRSVLNQSQPGDLIIWDNWHAPTDFGVSWELIESYPNLEKLKVLEVESRGRQVRYALFKRSR